MGAGVAGHAVDRCRRTRRRRAGAVIVRVISLLYPGPWNKDVFEWAHLYVWQALIMLDVLVVWVIGVGLAGVHRAGGGNALAA